MQTALDGFEINKHTDINAKYEKFFENSGKNGKMLPKLQRKKFRNLAKNKMAYQGAVADNNTTNRKI